MPAPNPRLPRNLPESVRRRVEVATAMAWEALVETHTRQAIDFVRLFEDRMELEHALIRYLREMDLSETIASAIRSRVLIEYEAEPEPTAVQLQLHADDADVDEAEDDEGWRRFMPDAVMRDLRQRQRRNEETDMLLELSLARAEEETIRTHIDNAITFVALLDGYTTMGRAVKYYLAAISLAGGRAQAVFQRTMARLAEVHLPGLTARSQVAR